LAERDEQLAAMKQQMAEMAEMLRKLKEAA
jgi:hypothetical protein